MPRVNSLQDLWSYIDVKQEAESCWNWKKSTADWRGYGQTHFGGKHWRSHRLIFFLTNGYLPPAVMHTCDNPSCCNPSHLIAGTNGLNNTDRAMKKRSNPKRGESYKLSKLKTEDVLFMRNAIKNKTHTMQALSKMFNIHRNYVSDVVNKRAWSHVE